MSDTELAQVGLPEEGKKTSPILDTPPAEDASEMRELCYFNGVAYSSGAQICSGGRRMQCYSNGSWSVIGSC